MVTKSGAFATLTGLYILNISFSHNHTMHFFYSLEIENLKLHFLEIKHIENFWFAFIMPLW